MNNIQIFINNKMKSAHWKKEKDTLGKNVYSLEYEGARDSWCILIYESYISNRLAFSFSSNISQLRELYYQRYPDSKFGKHDVHRAKMHIEYFIIYYNKIMQKLSAFI